MKTASPARRSFQRFPAAFTLVEMLVVIGIIVLLIGLLLPMLSRAYRNAERTKVGLDLQAISSALEAYRQDMNQYPPVTVPGDGARILCQALLGPGPVGTPGSPNTGDGADGFGFRTRTAVSGVAQSKVYGPYLTPDRLKVSDPSSLGQPASNPMTAVFIDRYRHPILYFPASPSKPNVRGTNGYIAASKQSLYDERDNLSFFASDPKRIHLMLGDYNNNGMIDSLDPSGPDVQTASGPYLLWSCGPDEQYGPDASLASDKNTLDRFDTFKCDDVTNFLP